MGDITILTEARLRSQARLEREQITLCDLTGTGIQDTALATFAYQLCQHRKTGTVFHN